MAAAPIVACNFGIRGTLFTILVALVGKKQMATAEMKNIKQEGIVMRVFWISLILFATAAEAAITISGKALLQGQTDNSGIKVRFIRTAPSTSIDSVLTAPDGGYSLTVDPGYYIISYRKPNYFRDTLKDTSYYANTNILDITLKPHTTLINVPNTFSTITKALEFCEKYDTILLSPGTYNENITLKGSKNTVIGSMFIITGDTQYISSTSVNGSSNGPVFEYTNYDSTQIIGLTIINGTIGITSNWWPKPGYIRISHSWITGNKSKEGMGGAGICCDDGSLRIDDCLISDNDITIGVQGIGAGISVSNTHLTMLNSVIRNNRTTSAGGGIAFRNCPPCTLTNVVIIQNISGNDLDYLRYPGGGGIACLGSSLAIINSTIADNSTSGNGGGIFCGWGTNDPGTGQTLTLINTIVAKNSSSRDSGNYEIFQIAHTLTPTNCLVWNKDNKTFYGCVSYIGRNLSVNVNGDPVDAYGNIQANPYFVNPSTGNYHLADWSRAIGAGTAVGTPATDIERIVRGNPPDIGAYENSRNTPIALPTPGVPLLVIPASNSIDIPLLILLKWHPSSCAFSYGLQIFTDAGLSVKVFDTSGVEDTFVNFTSALNATKYYWQVKAFNTSGSNSSSTSNFTTCSLVAPVLVSPSNNAANVSLNPVLVWNTSSGAPTYRIQFSTDSTFSSTITDDSTLSVTSITISSLSTNTKYYWRVKAKNAGGGVWSSIWNFTTIPAVFTVPTLASPSNSAPIQPLTTSLTWNAVMGATTYRIQLSTINVFTTGTTIVDDSMVASTFREIGPLSTNTTYYWHVSAKNAGGTSSWSDTWSFTTIPSTAGAPTLVSPKNGTATQPITLLWAAVSGASNYRVQVSTSSVFAGIVVDDSTLTLPLKAIDPLSNGIIYYWHVNAKSANGTSAWSETWTFTTISLVPNQVTLSSPVNAAMIVVDSVCLIWNKSLSGADKYCLEIFTDSLMNGRLLIDSTITDTVKVRKNFPNKATYWWQVKAHNISGWGAPSTLNKFTINIPAVAVLPSKYTCALNGISKAGSSIVYSLPAASDVSIKLYSMQGKLVQIICSSYQQAGYYQANMNYSIISKGYYLLDFKAGNYSVRRRITNF